MSNPEIHSNLEIGIFNSPEDLAKALENKNQNLAKRIREISKMYIEKYSKDLRKALQEELTPEEQSEIREALPESGVEKVLDKKTDKDIAVDGLSGVIGEKNINNLKKVEGFINKITTGFDKVGKVFKTKGFVAGLGAIVLMIKGFFTGDFSSFDKLLNPDKKGEKSDIKEGNEDKKNEIKYIGGIQLLFLIKGEKEKDYIRPILLQKEIKTKTFNELNDNFKKGKSGISERLGLTSKGDDEKVYDSIKLLIDNENFINSTIGKVKPDWREKEIGNTLLELHKKGSLLNGINKKISSIEFSTIPPELFNRLSSIDILNLNINPDKNEIDFGDFSDRAENIGVSKTTLLKIFSGEKIKNSSDSQLKNRYYGLCEENEKGFIDKLLNFHGEITKSMSNLFGNKSYGKFQEYFNTHGISSKNLIELYLITGGETKLENMDPVTKSLVYLKTWKILGDDKGFRGEYFDRELLEVFNKRDIIPEDVKSILMNIFGKIGELFLKDATGILSEIYEAIPNTYKIIIASTIGIALYISFKIAPLRAVMITAIAGMIVSATVGIAIENKYTKKQIENAIADYLRANNIL